jgi:HAD superfamily phosphoserine phosphatase-like hydrolase
VLSPFFCFDLDGTITRSEILPLVAKLKGIENEISDLTDKTLRGLIPFEDSFKLRCKMLQGIPTEAIHSLLKDVPLYEEIVEFINANSENCAVITGNIDVWIKPVSDQLKCSVYSSSGTFIEGKFDSVAQILDKGKVIDQLTQPNRKIFAIGDGMGDVKMFEKSDVSVAFGATHDPVISLIEVADFVTYSEESLCQFLKLQL